MNIKKDRKTKQKFNPHNLHVINNISLKNLFITKQQQLFTNNCLALFFGECLHCLINIITFIQYYNITTTIIIVVFVALV